MNVLTAWSSRQYVALHVALAAPALLGRSPNAAVQCAARALVQGGRPTRRRMCAAVRSSKFVGAL